jgi:hypothetical protein
MKCNDLIIFFFYINFIPFTKNKWKGEDEMFWQLFI